MSKILQEIKKELQKQSDEKTKSTSKRFFKEKVKFYGVRIPIVQKISKEYFLKLKTKSKEEIFKLCEKLWESGYLEESIIACNWSLALSKEYEQKDFDVFEKWINIYITNWASCDTFCNQTIGEFLLKYPEYVENVKKWTKSKNRWVRRASAVSLIIPARKGYFLKEVFEISDSLLLDKDDMVQKGYGWLLKVASAKNEKEVFDYVMKNKKEMPRTSLRYAIEKMPKKFKMEAMVQ